MYVCFQNIVPREDPQSTYDVRVMYKVEIVMYIVIGRQVDQANSDQI